MDRIEENYTNWLGQTKHVYKLGEDGFIIKVFKSKDKILPIQEQRKIIEMKKEYFGEYIPETELIEEENGEYVIKQKFVKGKTLAQSDISSLSSETLRKLIDLIKKYLQYHKEQGGHVDLTGYQYYPGNPNNLKRKFMNLLRISQNFLTSTNIMIGEDGNVYMVDICETTDSHFQGKIKNLLAKPFIKRTIFRLGKTLQEKVIFENKNTDIKLNAINE